MHLVIPEPYVIICYWKCKHMVKKWLAFAMILWCGEDLHTPRKTIKLYEAYYTTLDLYIEKISGNGISLPV